VKSGAASSSGDTARESAARANRARLRMRVDPPVGFASSDKYLTRFVWRDPAGTGEGLERRQRRIFSHLCSLFSSLEGGTRDLLRQPRKRAKERLLPENWVLRPGSCKGSSPPPPGGRGGLQHGGLLRYGLQWKAHHQRIWASV